MRTLLRRGIGLLGVGAAAAQAGHLISYQVQFGSAALTVESQGAHAYFPLVAKTGLGLAGIGVLTALGLIGAARLLSAKPQSVVTGPSYLPLLSGLFTLQMTLYAVQETVEALIAGTPAPSPAHLILFGSLGQLPVAAIAALVIKWIASRVAEAIAVLRRMPSMLAVAVESPLAPERPAEPPARGFLAGVCPSAYVKRGPPLALGV